MGLDREARKAAAKYRRTEQWVDEKTGAYTTIVIITIGLLGVIVGVVIGQFI